MATAILALKHSQFQAPLDAFRAAQTDKVLGDRDPRVGG
jgi:phosphoribosylcarboxyaminoimidazole (NCAIR) mutase